MRFRFTTTAQRPSTMDFETTPAMSEYLVKANALGISVDEYTDGEYTLRDGKVVPS